MESGGELRRTGTAPTGGQDHRAPTRTLTDIRSQNSASEHEQRRPFRRAPYSYQYNQDSNTDDSSSSEDEAEAPRKGPQGRRPSFRPSSREGKQKSYRKLEVGNDNFHSKSKVSRRDGRLKISVGQKADGRLKTWLGRGFQHHFDYAHQHAQNPTKHRRSHEENRIIKSLERDIPIPKLNIVVMVIGSRGDIQPFLKIGQILKERGHRVRIATHPTFRVFVEKDIGLEFFSVGGDPSELMAFMVKNPGLMPSFETVRQGEVGKRRNAMAEMFEGFWRSCINATDDESDEDNIRMMGKKHPFVADAIIANPPSFAHVHIAERLGIPLHMMFTFPYTPTQQFPHPLANIKTTSSNFDPNYINFMSYTLVEMMTWQGLGDLINRFRTRTLGLDPVSSFWAPDALWRMKIPYTYMWSPELVPKPADWGPEIDITGFVYLDLASNFKPPDDLKEFLDAGEAPIYIGFGSIVVDDAKKFTKLIFDAVKLAGVRALVSAGWGGIGEGDDTPENILMLGNTPHDWLFPKCRAVVHHGGAGTTAAGLKFGIPTVIVPFFGEQPFWGAMVADNKAGADESIPYKDLTAEKLADSIKQCLTDEAKENAHRIADSIEKEGDGAENAVKSFERSLPLSGHQNMRCAILEDRVAVWRLRHSSLRLSALAAEILVEQGKVKWKNLKLLRSYDYSDFGGPGEPISGVGGALMHTAHGIGAGLAEVPSNMHKRIKGGKTSAGQQRQQQRRLRKAAKAEAEAEKRGDVAPNRAEDSEDAAENEKNGLNKTASEGPLALELAEDAGLGLGSALCALLSAPHHILMALAQGFHNTPRLYGDSTVRKPKRIADATSGLVAARNELCFGFYDGFSGLVLQPVKGVKEAASAWGVVRGASAGVGKGIAGLALKPTSGLLSVIPFTIHGLSKEAQKRTCEAVAGGNIWIRRAHIIQGQKDLYALGQQEDGEEQVSQTYKRVEEGWETMLKLWEAMASYRKKHKLMGAYLMHRNHQKAEAAGVTESVASIRKTLELWKAGENQQKFDHFLDELRRHREDTSQPQGVEERKATEPERHDVH